jgi:hypothetical protein
VAGVCASPVVAAVPEPSPSELTVFPEPSPSVLLLELDASSPVALVAPVIGTEGVRPIPVAGAVVAVVVVVVEAGTVVVVTSLGWAATGAVVPEAKAVPVTARASAAADEAVRIFIENIVGSLVMVQRACTSHLLHRPTGALVTHYF